MIVGFMAIANLSANAIAAIERERETRGTFSSLEDAARRLALAREDFVSLVASGACDSLAPATPRSVQLRRLLITPRNTCDRHGQASLFPAQQPVPAYRQTQDITVSRGRTEAELHQEFESLGFLREHHPLLLWSRAIGRVRRIRAIDLPANIGRKVNLIGWPITRKTVFTKEGLPMDFISFEDEGSLYETVLFPQLHQRYRRLLHGQRPLLIFGTVCNDQGALHVEIISIQSIQ